MFDLLSSLSQLVLLAILLIIKLLFVLHPEILNKEL
mgnify:CR=1 FL=1